jgi:hypothetical protein
MRSLDLRNQALAFTTVFILMTAGVWGQYESLADVARAEEARRKTVKASGKVYTNDDLKRVGDDKGPPPPAPAAASSAAGDTPPAPAAKSEPADAQKPVADLKDEKYWRERITGAQLSMTRNKVLLEALQSRVNALNTDYVNRDDPAQRAAIDTNRQTAMTEMQRVLREIESQIKEIATIQEEARKAGVPAGWLR